MNFDEEINRYGTHSAKWDMMEKLWGVPAEDGIAKLSLISEDRAFDPDEVYGKD